MSGTGDRPVTPPGAVVVPGPSLTSEGLTRATVDSLKRAIVGLQGAADVFRSLAR